MELRMDGLIVAHGSGIDELMIFAMPVAFAIGFWLIIRQKPSEDEDEDQVPSTADPQAPDDH
jgi:hypothetical protein